MLLVGMAIGLAFFAEQVPFLIDLTQPTELKFESVEHPLDGLESAKVTVDWTSAPGYLSVLDDSDYLIEADVAYRGELAFKVEEHGDHAEVLLDSFLQGVSYGVFDFNDADAEWDVRLSPDVELALWLDSGSGSCDFDLTDLDISYLNVDSGSGSINLALPETSSFEGKMDSGSGSVTIILPNIVGLRVELDDGSGSFRYDDRFKLISGEYNGNGVWETEDFDKADYKIELEIDQGSGSIRIQ
jgi:hypothetical protein